VQRVRGFLDQLAEAEAQQIKSRMLATMRTRSRSAQLDPELEQLVKKILKEGASNALHGTALRRFESYGHHVHKLVPWFVLKKAWRIIEGHVARALKTAQKLAGAGRGASRKRQGGPDRRQPLDAPTVAQAFKSQLPSLVEAVVEDFKGDLRRRLDLCLMALKDSLSPSSSFMEHPCVAKRVVRVACSGTILQSYLKAIE
jgi:hypothetical protein